MISSQEECCWILVDDELPWTCEMWVWKQTQEWKIKLFCSCRKHIQRRSFWFSIGLDCTLTISSPSTIFSFSRFSCNSSGFILHFRRPSKPTVWKKATHYYPCWSIGFDLNQRQTPTNVTEPGAKRNGLDSIWRGRSKIILIRKQPGYSSFNLKYGLLI